MKSKGIALPLVIVFILIFVLTPVAFLLSMSLKKGTPIVMGVTTENSETPKNGLGLVVSSKYGTWELLQYLCKDKNECVAGLNSGKRIGSVGGGDTQDQLIIVKPSTDWDGNEYVKIYAKSGWGSSDRSFEVDLLQDSLDAEVLFMDNDGRSVNVLLVPLKSFKDQFFKLAAFFD